MIAGIKLTIEEVRKTANDVYGLRLISTEYKNNASPLEWEEISSGKVFSRSWSHIKRGNLTPRTMYDRYIDTKSMVESYKGLGYILDMTREEYNDAKMTGRNKLLRITHPSLDKEWIVKLPHFKKLAISHLNDSYRSLGEVYIETLLKDNNIKFLSQKSVTINGELHVFDFYIPDYRLYIEYDGKQHFFPINSWGGVSALKERRRKDRDKDNYVKEIGEHILRVDYTVDLNGELAEVIEKEIGVPLTKMSRTPYHSKGKYMSEVSTYYLLHSSKDTSEKFGIDRHTISRYFKLCNGVTKKEYINDSKTGL